MAYLGDPREGRIGPNGELWEMDNRVEKRYYWNGAYLDLCNLDPEDAMNRVVNVKVVSVKKTNKITLSSVEESGGSYQLKAAAEKSVETSLVIVCDYTIVDYNNKTTKGRTIINIPKGSTEGVTEIKGMSSVKSIAVDAKVGTSEKTADTKTCVDDNYTYTVTDLYSNTQNAVYYGIYPYMNDLNSITLADLSNRLEEETYKDTQINFVIPGIDWEPESNEEIEEYSYRLVIAVPAEYAPKVKIIDDLSEMDATDDFPNVMEINDNGNQLALLVRTNVNGELTPLMNEDLPIPYKLTISK